MRKVIQGVVAVCTLVAVGGPAMPVLPSAHIATAYEECLPDLVIVKYEAVPGKYRKIVEEINRETQIPTWIIARLYQWESGWDEQCAPPPNRNGSRDFGLAQLNSRYLDEFSWRYNDGDPIDPFNPETSLRVGMRHLARMYRSTGSWHGAVWAYNAGLSRYRRGVMPEKTAAELEYVFGFSR